MIIPPAMLIETAYDAIAHEPAEESERDQTGCAKELHVANPAFIRDLTFEQFALAAHAYYLGLKVAALIVERGGEP
jgi:hypothetical protein